MIFIAGISIGLFISALLLVKKNKTKSDYILLLWMLLNSIHIGFFYLMFSGKLYDYPHLLGLQFALPLLHGFMLYLYVATVTYQTPGKKFYYFFHLLPAIATLIYLIPFFILPSAEKIAIFKSGGKGYELFQQILLYLVFLSGIVYVIWSSILLRLHKKRIRDEFSNLEDVNLNWLRFLVIGLGTVWTLVILIQNDTLIFLAVSVFVILVGFFGIQQKNIFKTVESIALTPDIQTVKEPEDESPKADNESKKKYKSSGLSEEKSAHYYAQLTELVSEEKVYTDPDLSLSALASRLDIPANYLSQIINDKESKTFYDYINSFRIEEFKRLISIPKNQDFTLMAMAYDCGFNSKSSFNRYFKKITGLTPSQYLKAQKS